MNFRFLSFILLVLFCNLLSWEENNSNKYNKILTSDTLPREFIGAIYTIPMHEFEFDAIELGDNNTCLIDWFNLVRPRYKNYYIIYDTLVILDAWDTNFDNYYEDFKFKIYHDSLRYISNSWDIVLHRNDSYVKTRLENRPIDVLPNIVEVPVYFPRFKPSTLSKKQVANFKWTNTNISREYSFFRNNRFKVFVFFNKNIALEGSYFIYNDTLLVSYPYEEFFINDSIYLKESKFILKDDFLFLIEDGYYKDSEFVAIKRKYKFSKIMIEKPMARN